MLLTLENCWIGRVAMHAEVRFNVWGDFKSGLSIEISDGTIWEIGRRLSGRTTWQASIRHFGANFGANIGENFGNFASNFAPFFFWGGGGSSLFFGNFVQQKGGDNRLTIPFVFLIVRNYFENNDVM